MIPRRLPNLRGRRVIWIGFLVAFVGAAVSTSADVSVSFQPTPICAEFGQALTAYVWVDSAGSEFDGYEALIRFDPTVVEYVSTQEDTLLWELCYSTWWFVEPGDSTVFISHVALCGGLTVTGPGALSSITFLAGDAAAETNISFDYIEFYRAGTEVPSESHDGAVFVREDCSLAACCDAETGDCTLLGEDDCLAAGGLWYPEWLSCEPNPCPAMEVQDSPVSMDTRLHPGRPDPVLGHTVLNYHLRESGELRIAIFDLTGRCVRQLYDGRAPAGPGMIAWDGKNGDATPVPPGAYFCRLSAEGVVCSQRLLVVR